MKSLCETCKDITCCAFTLECGECLDYERQTNANRIRAMSDDELADFIGGIFSVETDIWGRPDPRLVVTQNPRVEVRNAQCESQPFMQPIFFYPVFADY